MDERLIKGIEISKDAEDFEYVASGKAEGVVYFDERRNVTYDRDINTGNEVKNIKVIIEGKERQALSYLKPVSSEWKARNPGMQGFSRPDIFHLLPVDARKESEMAGVAIKWIINAEHPKAVNAQDYPLNWAFHKVEDGVWVILWKD